MSDRPAERVEHDSETGDRWFASSFEESRFDALWKFRLASAAESVFLAVVCAVTGVLLYRLGVGAGLFDTVMLLHSEPTYTIPPELESLPEVQIQLIYFIQLIAFLILALVHLVVQILAVAAIVGCGLIAVALIVLAFGELELAYKKPIDIDSVVDSDE